MKTEIDASRLLVWRAAWMAANHKKFENGEGSMSKLKAGETAVRVTEDAIQILGGYGYVREYPVERWHRDAKIYTIFEGTSEIQRLVIARAISWRAHPLTVRAPHTRQLADCQVPPRHSASSGAPSATGTSTHPRSHSPGANGRRGSDGVRVDSVPVYT